MILERSRYRGDLDRIEVEAEATLDGPLVAPLLSLLPTVALIEVGAHNDYGHPTAQALAALATARVPAIARTDHDGVVRIDLGPRGTSVARSPP